MTFEELQLAPAIVQAVQELGYTAPTPIQQQAIPLILAGNDLLGGAQTGTGKTAAFLLPIIEKLSKKPIRNTVLILSPTRELSQQIDDEFKLWYCQ